MLKPYEEGWSPYKSTKEVYIKETTIANTVESVKKVLNDFINLNAENDFVINFLENLLNDEIMLNKTHVVWDGSYRTTLFLVRTDNIMPRSYYGKLTIEEAYNYLRDNAETFFINLDKEPSEEREYRFELEWEMLNNMLDEYRCIDCGRSSEMCKCEF